MDKNLKIISLKYFSKKFNGILTNDIEECKEIMKTNKKAKLLVVIPKDNTTPPNDTVAPPWFQEYEKKQDKRWAKQEAFNKKQDKRWAKQEAFNKKVIKRLDKVDQRLDKLDSRIDNLVKKNKLKE